MPVLSAQLLLGGRRRDGSRIGEAAWRHFLATRITPRFPAGLTVLPGQGQWTGPDGRLLREPARVVLIVTAASPQALADLDAIREEYRTAFDQNSAGLVLTRGCARF